MFSEKAHFSPLSNIPPKTETNFCIVFLLHCIFIKDNFHIKAITCISMENIILNSLHFIKS